MAKERKAWKLNGLITSAIRKLWQRSPLKAKALELALTNPEAKKYDYLYTCAVCGSAYPAQKVEVNHKEAGFTTETWDQFISRIFCHVEEVVWVNGGGYVKTPTVTNLESIVKQHLEVVCKECHAKITKDQRAKAKAAKKAGK